jgi:hypothetical protein
MIHHHLKLLLLPGFCLITLFSCNRGDRSIRVYSVKKEHSQQKTEPAQEMVSPSTQSGFAWTMPETWVEEPASGMHLAAFSIPREGGRDQVTIMSLQGDGGGMLLNVNRWLDQLTMAPVTESGLKKMETLEKGAMGEYRLFELVNKNQPGKAFLVAVFSLPEQTLFVKLVTSEAQIQAEKTSFMAFCTSIHIHD